MSGRLVLAAVAVVLGGTLVIGGNGALKMRQMQRDLDALERDIAQLRLKSQELQRTVERLKNDPAYIEKRVREDLGWVKGDETVLKFPSQRK